MLDAISCFILAVILQGIAEESKYGPAIKELELLQAMLKLNTVRKVKKPAPSQVNRNIAFSIFRNFCLILLLNVQGLVTISFREQNNS